MATLHQLEVPCVDKGFTSDDLQTQTDHEIAFELLKNNKVT